VTAKTRRDLRCLRALPSNSLKSRNIARGIFGGTSLLEAVGRGLAAWLAEKLTDIASVAQAKSRPFSTREKGHHAEQPHQVAGPRRALPTPSAPRLTHLMEVP